MTRWTPRKKDVLDSLADEILHNYGKGRVSVAVDGTEASGAGRLADELAEVLRSKQHAVFRASLSDFHRATADRDARSLDDGDGYYRDRFDYSTFQRVLVQPFKKVSSGAFVLAAFDAERNASIEPKWITAPEDAILLVDGPFLNRPELRGLWNHSIWMEAGSDAADLRVLEMEGIADPGVPGMAMPEPVVPAVAEDDLRDARAMELYRAGSAPRTRADAIVDYRDPEHPRRIFADSC